MKRDLISQTDRIRLIVAMAKNTSSGSPSSIPSSTKGVLEHITKWVPLLVGLAALIVNIIGLHNSRMATIESNRAWLHQENIKFYIDPASNTIKISGDTLNVGKEPAKDVEFSDLIYVFTVNYSPNFLHDIYQAEKENVCNHSTAHYGESVFPGQQLRYDRYLNVTPTEISDILTNQKILVVQDCASYVTYEQVHHTKFCYYYGYETLGADKSAVFCGGGNGAD